MLSYLNVKLPANNLPRETRVNIVSLQEWIEKTSSKKYIFSRQSIDSYNYYELCESMDNDVDMLFYYRRSDKELRIKLPYAKVVEILAAIKSGKWDDQAILEKILTKFKA